MNRQEYIPAPLDTSAVELPPFAQALAEAMARNTHEVWSAARLADGWVWGETRDDAKKQHPCLVPYDLLGESEKEYDRRTSAEAIRFLLAAGCRILPPEAPALQKGDEQ